MREARICTQAILSFPTLSIRSCTYAMEASQPRGQVLGNWTVEQMEVLGGWYAQKLQGLCLFQDTQYMHFLHLSLA